MPPRVYYVFDELKSSGPYASMRELSVRYRRGDVLAPQRQDELSAIACDHLFVFFGVNEPSLELEMPALGFELDDISQRGRVGYRPTDLRPHYKLIQDRYGASTRQMSQLRHRGGPLLSSFAHAMTTFHPDEVRELTASSERVFDAFAAQCKLCPFAVQTDLGGDPEVLVAGRIPLRAATEVRLGGRWHKLPLW